MEEKLQILYDNLLTICSSIIDFGLKYDSQLSFTLENVVTDEINQIDVFVSEFYETEWKWGKHEIFNGNFKGTADYPQNVNASKK